MPGCKGDIFQGSSPDAVHTAWTGLGGCQQRQVLGVEISSNLKWNTHVDRITANANRSLGFIRRNVKTKSPQIREMAYQSLVRPQLEYASAVWDPHIDELTNKLEMVQRRAARWTLHDYARTTSATSLLSQLTGIPLKRDDLWPVSVSSTKS